MLGRSLAEEGLQKTTMRISLMLRMMARIRISFMMREMIRISSMIRMTMATIMSRMKRCVTQKR